MKNAVSSNLINLRAVRHNSDKVDSCLKLKCRMISGRITGFLLGKYIYVAS